MAKQLVNPIERHFEKGVLGVAGLALIGAVALYLVSSPNKIEMGGEIVTPASVDQQLARKAADVRDRIERAPTTPEDVPEPIASELDRWLDPYKAASLPTQLPSVFAIGPEVPRIDPPETVGAGLAELASVAKTSDPVVVAGRSTFLRDTPSGIMRREVANWVTVAVMFDVKEQMAIQQRAYGATRKGVIFGPLEMQRRMRRDDGSWSDEDWLDVECSPAAVLPNLPAFQLVATPEGVIVPRDREQAIDTYLKNLSDPLTQLDIVRPRMPEWANGDRWTVPIITSRLDVLKQDDQFLNPTLPPAPNPMDRYVGLDQAGPVAVTAVVETKSVAERLNELKDRIERSWQMKSRNEATLAYNELMELSRDAAATGSERSRAKALMAQAEQRERDIDRWLASGGAARAADEDADEVGGREPFPTQQLWAHDAAPESIESGRTYQYRVRPTVANRLLGQPEKLRQPNDALTPFVSGEWTEPVEVKVPLDTEFYVTSYNERNRQIGIEFYKWFDGVWVNERFYFGIGDRLLEKGRVEAPSQTDPTVVDRPEVTFSADATVLDIDFQRSYRKRKPGTTRQGVRFDELDTTCAVVFTDTSGRVFERVVEFDKDDPRKRLAQSRKWTPPRTRP